MAVLEQVMTELFAMGACCHELQLCPAEKAAHTLQSRCIQGWQTIWARATTKYRLYKPVETQRAMLQQGTPIQALL